MTILKRAWGATWRVLLFVITWAVLYAPVVVPFALRARPGTDFNEPALQLLANAAGAVTLLLASWLLLRFVDRLPFASLGLGTRGLARDLGGGIALGAAMMILAAAVLLAAGWARMSAEPIRVPPAMAIVALMLSLNAAVQTLLFRGYILQTIERAAGSAWAVGITAVLFMAAHGKALTAGVIPALNLLLAGVLLALAFTRTRALWLPMGIHLAWNFVQGPVLGVAVSGHVIPGGVRVLEIAGPPLVTGGGFGIEGGLAGTLATVIGITAVVWLTRGRGAGGRA